MLAAQDQMDLAPQDIFAAKVERGWMVVVDSKVDRYCEPGLIQHLVPEADADRLKRPGVLEVDGDFCQIVEGPREATWLTTR